MTRSVAIFSTNIWAARRSTLSRRPSQSSSRRHKATVCGLTANLAAISEFRRISPVRNSLRASSRVLLDTLAIRPLL